jgi:SAM-dependent methyltransferase
MDYRSAVGPPDLYDVIGALQFRVMVGEGLREWHTFLDIGCGSLRGGRFFMVYLQPSRYFGIEPDQQLVYTGIQANLGESIWAVKKPEFHYSREFDLSYFNVQFNYILAQSIFSHAAPHMINKCLSEIQKVLAPNGTFIATYFKGTTDYKGTTWAQAPDARYTQTWLKNMCSSHGLTLQTLSHAHPSAQTWVRIRRK